MLLTPPKTPLSPESPVGELLLAETAIRIELPPSQRRKAIDRYGSARTHIEREGSPLHDLVAWFYPQGSMAIRATIRARRRDDGYDIDIVAELNLPADTSPETALDLLFEALNGPPGSRYHGQVERQTRCVTIHYADGMHLDVTPSIVIDPQDARKSVIFHAKPGAPAAEHFTKIMNSWAFCEHVLANTPADLAFREAYGKRVRIHDRELLAEDAAYKDVPDAELGKSALVVAHQLMKRNRNSRYQSRKGLRMPPSVMMAAVMVDAVIEGASISQALFAITGDLLERLESAEREGRLVDIRNPKCRDDAFTDRWPEHRESQRLYIGDLKLFRVQLKDLISGERDLEEQRALLTEMFGEGPAVSVIEDYASRLSEAVRTGARHHLVTGRVAPAIIGATSAVPAAARPHTFYGGLLDDEDH
ncbi:nucleotidyltransferase [Marinicaulis aureus]|uniref:Nucleotidyltransferase n=1 Tax=Hyphococcus aureus TaxID=2666033 RepID=A0ABW1KXP7_9PROT